MFRVDPHTVHAVAADAAFSGHSTRWHVVLPERASPRVDRESRTIDAPVRRVFDALIEPTALAEWLPPSGMRGRFEHADIRPGGSYSLILVPDNPVDGGKAGDGSDVVVPRIAEIVPGERIVQEIDFESDDSVFLGTMTMTWTVTAVHEGTLVEIIATDVPTGISPEDHSAGARVIAREPRRPPRAGTTPPLT